MPFAPREHERRPCSRARCHAKGSVATDSGIAPEVMEKINRSPLANATLALVNDTFATFPSRR